MDFFTSISVQTTTRGCKSFDIPERERHSWGKLLNWISFKFYLVCISEKQLPVIPSLVKWGLWPDWQLKVSLLQVIDRRTGTTRTQPWGDSKKYSEQKKLPSSKDVHLSLKNNEMKRRGCSFDWQSEVNLL